jgi:peptidoglycan/LPS O-acetylase OafA/YrhL
MSKASWRLSLPWLEKIGDASYSLYLSHFMVMSAVGQVGKKILGTSASPLGLALFAVAATVICVLASLVVHRFIEMKLHDATRFLKPRRRVPA